MALIATPGAPDANSYLTVLEADAYFDTHLYATAWDALDEPSKEAALIMATRVMDTQCYKGQATTETQALQWPRSGLMTATGYPLPDNVIPQQLKYATAEMSLMLVQTNTTVESDASIQGLRSISAGPVSISFKDDIEYKSVPGNVTALLVPSWLCDVPAENGNMLFRMV